MLNIRDPNFIANIIGAIISSTILNQRGENTTLPADDYTLSLCGRNDCPDNNVTNVNLEKPASSVVGSRFMSFCT